jgi:1-acyl-sn-glycerol-3-phosphate acyltransferase
MYWQPLGPELPQTNNWLRRWIGRVVFRCLGWQIKGEFPNHSKLIVVVAPHTSMMDYILAMAVIWGLGLRASHLVKKSLFRFPLGILMTWLGGIPVDRSSPHGLVEQLVEQFQTRTKLIIGLAPEGRRGQGWEWKSGFARIAHSTRIPILPAILDYDDRIVHLQPLIRDLEDVDAIISAAKQSAAVGTPKHKPR